MQTVQAVAALPATITKHLDDHDTSTPSIHQGAGPFVNGMGLWVAPHDLLER